MANTTIKKADSYDPWSDMQTVVVPRIPGVKEQPDLVVTLNFKTYRIQRGKQVKIPLPIAEIVEQHIEAEVKAEEYYFASSQIKGN